MQLKEFVLINPKLEASLVFQAIQTAIAPEMIAQELEKSNSFEKRQRKFPASLVVCLIIATRKGRHNPRVVKKTRSKFPSKKPIHRQMSRQPKQLIFSIFNSA